ncbi:EspA/EspE family type VII secretion system effector [Mycobacterium sp. DL99]|uniref:EspA/EspE family type VII secretion system effector n=1 Tax=Mycobacterium sp. DL99 TaxID=2528957 RepID=UPI001081AC57|nr:EspA/EspE family type VII secretion system effector [Mycobacterium sp. DL99]
MEGDPIGAVGLLGDAGKWAQLLIPEAIATPVIQGGLYVLTGVSKTMGVGSPDTGGSFNDGAKLFQSNGKSLEGAYPTESWSGSASGAYTSQNSHQIQRASTMLEADNAIVRVLSTQAGQVDHARTQVDWAAKGLAAMIPVAMALEATVFGAPESIALQFAAVATASGFAGVAVGNLMSYAQDNAAQIREATEKYRQAGAANTSGTGSPASPADSDNQNGSDKPGNPTGQDIPGPQSGPTSNGNPGGRSGGGSSAGSGSGTGSGSGSPTTPSMPSTTGAPAGVSTAASTGTGSGGMPSLPQMGGGSGGGGASMLGSFMGAAGQVAQAVTQAVQQANQQDQNGEKGTGTDDGRPGDEPGAAPAAQPAQASEQSGATANTESHAGRAPIGTPFNTGAASPTAPRHLTTNL